VVCLDLICFCKCFTTYVAMGGGGYDYFSLLLILPVVEIVFLLSSSHAVSLGVTSLSVFPLVLVAPTSPAKSPAY